MGFVKFINNQHEPSLGFVFYYLLYKYLLTPPFVKGMGAGWLKIKKQEPSHAEACEGGSSLPDGRRR